MAPEVITQSGHGRSSDIWSVGATVIEMATGRPPWPEFGNNLAALFHVATTKVPPPAPAHLSQTCVSFLARCLVIDARGRASAAELMQSDPFLMASPKAGEKGGTFSPAAGSPEQRTRTTSTSSNLSPGGASRRREEEEPDVLNRSVMPPGSVPAGGGNKPPSASASPSASSASSRSNPLQDDPYQSVKTAFETSLAESLVLFPDEEAPGLKGSALDASLSQLSMASTLSGLSLADEGSKKK